MDYRRGPCAGAGATGSGIPDAVGVARRMTTFYLRTRPTEPAPGRGILLDWFGRGGSSTVSATLRDLLRPGEASHPLALDLLRLAVAVYGADKVAERKQEADRWTRSLELRIP